MKFDGAAFARTLPHAPGVYRMLDADGQLLYVGKALDLRRRVASYFRASPRPHRQARMLAQVHSMDTTITANEAEALVLESRLIKTQNPRYNIALRDDAGYPYLFVSTHQQVPRIRLHRGARGSQGRYFGPYPNREAARAGLDAILRGFRLRSCKDGFFRNRSRPCLEYQIGRCSGPCVEGLVSPEEYRQCVGQACAFLEGKSDAIISGLVQEMERASQEQQFERAAILRDRIGLLRRLQSHMAVESSPSARDAIAMACAADQCTVVLVPFREGHASQARIFHPRLPKGAPVEPARMLSTFLVQCYLDHAPPPEILLDPWPIDAETLAQALSQLAGRRVRLNPASRGERAQQLAMARRNAQQSLWQRCQSRELLEQRRQDLARLLDLPRPPERMECFDISHTQGEATRASCVVFGPEGPMKSSYRHYAIEGIAPGDDYAAMKQALSRRFATPGPLPDLLLIDGGAGQVAQAQAVVEQRSLSVPIVGIAKGPQRKTGAEELILADSGRILRPGPASPALLLLAQVRDEAHRFAVFGHRRAREKHRNRSPLEDIAGIGPTRRRALLVAFGGLAGLRRASVQEIARVPGISQALAQRVAATLAAQRP